MGITFLEDKKLYRVSFSKRHPETRQPTNRTKTHLKDSNGLKKPITTKAEAKRVYRQLILDVEEVLTRKSKPTWKQLLEKFEPHYISTGVELKTVETYMCCLNKHTSEWFNIGCEKIHDNMIREIITNIDRSQSHKKNMLKFIRRVFQFALEEGFINRNPSPNMKFKFGQKNAKVLTKTEVAKLLRFAKSYDSKWYNHWLLALYTGMRNGELYALKWSDINFETNLINVKRSWNNKDGFKTTKSGDERIIPIATDLKGKLKSLKIQSQSDEFVLPRLHKWKKGEQARELRLFLKSVGLPEVRFHDLRATWATLLLGSSVPPVKVMAMGGWKDMKTMMVYVRKAGVDVHGSTDCLDFNHKEDSTRKVLNFERI